MKKYSFLRAIMDIMGYKEEEIDKIIDQIGDDPEEYQKLLVHLEDKIADSRRKTNENY
jgi:hypothetical protein